jgi:hypothetical protein
MGNIMAFDSTPCCSHVFFYSQPAIRAAVSVQHSLVEDDDQVRDICFSRQGDASFPLE